MKNFLKKNLFFIIGFIVCFILLVLSVFSMIFTLAGMFLMGILFLAVAYRFRNRYKNLVTSKEKENQVFDATLYDYDEDIYYLDTGKKTYSAQIKEGFFAKISTQAPCIFFTLFGIGLIVLSLTIIITVLI